MNENVFEGDALSDLLVSQTLFGFSHQLEP